MIPFSFRSRKCLPLLLFLLSATTINAATPYNFRIYGFGILGSLQLKKSIQFLRDPDDPQPLSDCTVENALWILDCEVKSQGYLHPSFSIIIHAPHQPISKTHWADGEFDTPLPPYSEYCKVSINVHEGILYYYDSICADGLPPDFNEKIEDFFYTSDFLSTTKSDRPYSPSRFNSSLHTIRRSLEHLGYKDAEVLPSEVNIDDTTGAVQANFTVNPDPKYFVRSITIKTTDDCEPQTEYLPEQIYTTSWLRNYLNSLRAPYYEAGYPDVSTEATVLYEDYDESCTDIDLRVTIDPGLYTELNDIQFLNIGDTDCSTLKKRHTLDPGSPLNPLKVEEYRDRLANLGIYNSIELSYEDHSPGQRNAIFKFKAKKKLTVNALVGVGSYEKLRAGLEVKRNNLFGLAHYAQIKAIQSLKSTDVRGFYNVPEFLRLNTSAYGILHFLRREEIGFNRHEGTLALGIQHFFPKPHVYAALQYNLQKLKIKNENFSPTVGRNDSIVSAIELILQQNKLDNPLYPESCYKLFGSAEAAFNALFGNVEFQRFELGGSYHHPLGGGRFLHLGLKHGAITTISSSQRNIPISKRFFLGGETTVRGFRQGQASPLDINGDVAGSVSYLLFNGEIQQKILPKLSLIAFIDAIGFAKDIENYPFDKTLVTIGPALSLHTIVGPLRFSYGYNLNPRTNDPPALFHISLGYPF